MANFINLSVVIVFLLGMAGMGIHICPNKLLKG